MIERQHQECLVDCASTAAGDAQRCDDSSANRRAARRPMAADAREWRWGAWSRPEPTEQLVETAADRRRRWLEDRLDQAFNVTVIVVTVVVFLLVCVWITAWILSFVYGGYCCGPE